MKDNTMLRSSLPTSLKALLPGLILLPMVLLAVAAFALDAPAPKPLETSDKLQIRESQLALAQAHIARLQAEAQIKAVEIQISQIVETLKVQYSCQNCTLNADFTWTKPEPPKAPTMSAPSPAPKKGGQTSAKE